MSLDSIGRVRAGARFRAQEQAVGRKPGGPVFEGIAESRQQRRARTGAVEEKIGLDPAPVLQQQRGQAAVVALLHSGNRAVPALDPRRIAARLEDNAVALGIEPQGVVTTAEGRIRALGGVDELSIGGDDRGGEMPVVGRRPAGASRLDPGLVKLSVAERGAVAAEQLMPGLSTRGPAIEASREPMRRHARANQVHLVEADRGVEAPHSRHGRREPVGERGRVRRQREQCHTGLRERARKGERRGQADDPAARDADRPETPLLHAGIAALRCARKSAWSGIRCTAPAIWPLSLAIARARAASFGRSARSSQPSGRMPWPT